MHCVFAQERRANIIHNHLLNIPFPVLLAKQILAQYRSGNFRHMLVLRDSRNFALAEAAQCNTVFERYHLRMIRDSSGRQIDPAQPFRSFPWKWAMDLIWRKALSHMSTRFFCL